MTTNKKILNDIENQSEQEPHNLDSQDQANEKSGAGYYDYNYDLERFSKDLLRLIPPNLFDTNNGNAYSECRSQVWEFLEHLPVEPPDHRQLIKEFSTDASHQYCLVYEGLYCDRCSHFHVLQLEIKKKC